MRVTRTSLLLLVSLVLAGQAIAQDGGQSPRQRLLMDYGWTFTTGDPSDAESPDFDDSSWRPVDLPHDWSIEGPYDENAATGGRGGYLPTGVGWYRRSFRLPACASPSRGAQPGCRRSETATRPITARIRPPSAGRSTACCWP